MSDKKQARIHIPKPPEKITIQIVYVPSTKEFQFQGPMDNPPICLGLLEMAKVVVGTQMTKSGVSKSGLVVPH